VGINGPVQAGRDQIVNVGFHDPEVIGLPRRLMEAGHHPAVVVQAIKINIGGKDLGIRRETPRLLEDDPILRNQQVPAEDNVIG
jgi:hypothetical protein